jgi:hypothetical protein
MLGVYALPAGAVDPSVAGPNLDCVVVRSTVEHGSGSFNGVEEPIAAIFLDALDNVNAQEEIDAGSFFQSGSR